MWCEYVGDNVVYLGVDDFVVDKEAIEKLRPEERAQRRGSHESERRRQSDSEGSVAHFWRIDQGCAPRRGLAAG